MPLFMGNTGQLGVPSVARALPIVRTFSPTVFGGNFIAGITYSSAGAVLPNCIVQMFRTADDSYISQTTSDALGYFYMPASAELSHYLVAYLAGTPDVAGTTLNTLIGGMTAVQQVAYSAEAQQFFSRLVTQPTSARKTLYNTLINSLVSAAIWTKLDVLYVFAAADAATALTNLVQTSYGGTATNSPTFAVDVGYTGADPAKYVDSGFNPSTATSPKYVRDSATLFGWCGQTGNTTGQVTGQTGTGAFLYPGNGGFAYCAINEAVTFNFSVAVADDLGLYHGNRSAAGAVQFYKSGASIGTSANASVAVENSDIVFGSTGAGNTTIVRAGGFGQTLDATAAAALNTAMVAYMAGL